MAYKKFKLSYDTAWAAYIIKGGHDAGRTFGWQQYPLDSFLRDAVGQRGSIEVSTRPRRGFHRVSMAFTCAPVYGMRYKVTSPSRLAGAYFCFEGIVKYFDRHPKKLSLYIRTHRN
jgi:hypothetical protein